MKSDPLVTAKLYYDEYIEGMALTLRSGKKINLGRLDLPSVSVKIEGTMVGIKGNSGAGVDNLSFISEVSNDVPVGVMMIPLDAFKLMPNQEMEDLKKAFSSKTGADAYTKSALESAESLNRLFKEISSKEENAFVTLDNPKGNKLSYAQVGDANCLVAVGANDKDTDKIANSSTVTDAAKKFFEEAGLPTPKFSSTATVRYNTGGKFWFQKFLMFGLDWQVFSTLAAIPVAKMLSRVIAVQVEALAARIESRIVAEIEAEIVEKLSVGEAFEIQFETTLTRRFYFGIRWLQGSSIWAKGLRLLGSTILFVAV